MMPAISVCADCSETPDFKRAIAWKFRAPRPISPAGIIELVVQISTVSNRNGNLNSGGKIPMMVNNWSPNLIWRPTSLFVRSEDSLP